jgi:hypothetical protein
VRRDKLRESVGLLIKLLTHIQVMNGEEPAVNGDDDSTRKKNNKRKRRNADDKLEEISKWNFVNFESYR